MTSTSASARQHPNAPEVRSATLPAMRATLPESDEVFAVPRKQVDDFSFNGEVTAVFDDMVERSVPFYAEIQRMTAALAADYVQPGTNLYDLGCSTCTTFLAIDQLIPKDMPVTLIGVDDSPEMLSKARAKLDAVSFSRTYELEANDLNEGVAVSNASVVLLVLTLQFIRPLYREQVIKKIYDGMVDKGCLLIVEKVLGENSTFNRLFINHYYELKTRNGYSQLEISQKREALENVLVPYRLEENKELLARVGFRDVDVYFKWFNFCGIIAMK